LPQACRWKKKTGVHCVNATTRNVKRTGLGRVYIETGGEKVCCALRQEATAGNDNAGASPALESLECY
jgi:hypothetical protein